jgi:hypothetical protein
MMMVVVVVVIMIQPATFVMTPYAVCQEITCGHYFTRMDSH